MAYPLYEDNGGIVAASFTGNLNIPFPATVNSNDILIACISIYSSGGSFTPPSGWVSIHIDGGGSLATEVFWLRADGTESGTTLFVGDPSMNQGISGIIYRYSGCVTSGTPYEQLTSSGAIDFVNNITHSNIVSLGNERLGVIFLNSSTQTTAVDGGTTGYTENSNQGATSIRSFNFVALSEQIPNSSYVDGIVDYDYANQSVEAIGFLLLPEIPDGAMSGTINAGSTVTGRMQGYIAGTINTGSTVTGNLTGVTAGDPDFNVQAIQDDIPATGGTNTSFTSVSSLDSAIEIADNNRKVHAGDQPNTTANLEGDDMAGGRQLTGVGTLTYYRESASKVANMRFNTSIWEYLGGAGGDNEFIVRGRFAIVLNGTTNDVTQALTGVVNANKCIPFITGFLNNSIADDADTASGVAYLENATTMRVQKGSNANNSTVYITVVEFTGVNWTVLHGDASSIADTGSITLYDGSDATGTATNVSAWGEAAIFGHHRGNYLADGVDDALADLYPVYDVGANLQTVDWTFDVNHAAVANNRHFIHVLNNSGLSVTRYQNTSNTAGETTIDITSAGLTNVNQALIIGSSRTSGTGVAYARGWRNYYLNSTTQAAHWCHRSGNTMAHEIQIIDLANLKTIAESGGAISGSSTSITTTSGTLSGKGSLVGVVNCSTTTTADLTVQSVVGVLSGTISGVSTISAILTAKGIVQASINPASTVTGVLSARGSLESNINASSTVLGALSAKGKLSSSINTSSTTSGQLTPAATVGVLSGTINTGSTISGELIAKGELKSSISLSSSVTGILSGNGVLSSAINTGSVVTGILTAQTSTGILSSTVNTGSTVTGVLTAKGVLTGSVSTNSTVSGNLTTQASIGALSGTINAGSTTVGILKGKGRLSASVNSASISTGILTTKGVLSGTVNSSTSLQAILTAKGAISGVSNSSASVTSLLTGKGALSGSINTGSVVIGNLKSDAISGVINTGSIVTGVLTAKGVLSGAINTSSNVSLVLSGKGELIGVINTFSSVSAILSINTNFAGTINTGSTVTGHLRNGSLDVYADLDYSKFEIQITNKPILGVKISPIKTLDIDISAASKLGVIAKSNPELGVDIANQSIFNINILKK